MSANIDDLPLYDDLVNKSTGMLSPIWRDQLATLVQTLQSYLTSGGIFVPRITEAQRDKLKNVQPGQIIYNETTSKLQGYEGSPLAWTDLV